MSQVTHLASGAITNHDEITVILIKPDGTPALVRMHCPLRPTTAAATHYPAVAAAIVRIIAESATALSRQRRENCEQRLQSVRDIPGRSPRSRGVRAVGVVGGAQLDPRTRNVITARSGPDPNRSEEIR
jgi:hypothetical protein